MYAGKRERGKRRLLRKGVASHFLHCKQQKLRGVSTVKGFAGGPPLSSEQTELGTGLGSNREAGTRKNLPRELQPDTQRHHCWHCHHCPLAATLLNADSLTHCILASYPWSVLPAPRCRRGRLSLLGGLPGWEGDACPSPCPVFIVGA